MWTLKNRGKWNVSCYIWTEFSTAQTVCLVEAFLVVFQSFRLDPHPNLFSAWCSWSKLSKFAFRIPHLHDTQQTLTTCPDVLVRAAFLCFSNSMNPWTSHVLLEWHHPMCLVVVSLKRYMLCRCRVVNLQLKSVVLFGFKVNLCSYSLDSLLSLPGLSHLTLAFQSFISRQNPCPALTFLGRGWTLIG